LGGICSTSLGGIMSSTRRSTRATSSSEGIVCIVQSTVTRSGSLGGIMSSTRRSTRATSSSEGIVQSTVTRSGCWFSCSRCSFVRGWFMRGTTHLGSAAGQEADVARPTSLLDEATRLKGTSDVAHLVWPLATLKSELTVSTKLITKRLSSSRTRGHRLGPNRALVGRQPCSCCGGHMTWACRQCGAVVYAPPIGPRCRVLHGAAAVR